MSRLVQTVRAAAMAGLARVLDCWENPSSTLLAPAYTLAQWLNDQSTPREEKRYILAMLAKAPLLKERLAGGAFDEDNWDCRVGDQPARGLGCAWFLSGLAVSLASDTQWDSAVVEASLLSVRLDESDIHEQSIAVPHASALSHVDANAAHLVRMMLGGVEDGEQLWRARGALFPQLSMCPAVEKQLSALSRSNPVFGAVLQRLAALQQYCQGWDAGHFDLEAVGFDASPESAATLEHYAAERTFSCPDGVTRLFSLHFKVGSWRLYFEPEPATRTAFVGYVGPHLRTHRFRA